MDETRLGALLVLCSAAGFGTLGVLGIVAGDAGISIPTILSWRFGLATVLVPAAAFLGESIGRRQLAALAVTLGGIALITGADPAADLRGIAVVLLAAVLYAGYITTSRTALEDVPPATLTAHIMPAATGTFLVVGAATDTLDVPSGALASGSIVAIAAGESLVIVGVALVARQ